MVKEKLPPTDAPTVEPVESEVLASVESGSGPAWHSRHDVNLRIG